MHFSVLIATAFAAIAAASPLPRPDYELYLTLQGRTDGQGHPIYVSANAVRNGTDSHYIFTGERLSVYPGTPFNFNGVSPTGNIFFYIGGDKTAGAAVISPGHVDGNMFPVTATEGQNGDGQWSIIEKTLLVRHKLFATTNTFYLCNGIVNGQEHSVLKFGNPYRDGTLPKGCMGTTLQAVKKQN